MTRLIVLNGPPGIGKSTLAARYADNSPGMLNLDIDQLHSFIGGWRQLGGRVHDLLRPLALSMAATHLAAGRDVIVPQFLADAQQAARFEQVAAECGADFVEVVLMADEDEAVARFDARPNDGAWVRHNRQIVASMGGPAALAAMHRDLVEYLTHRPGARTVHSIEGTIEATYAALERVLTSPA